LTSSVFLKSEQRIMALAMIMVLCLLVYSLGQRLIRRNLAREGECSGSEGQGYQQTHATLDLSAVHVGSLPDARWTAGHHQPHRRAIFCTSSRRPAANTICSNEKVPECGLPYLKQLLHRDDHSVPTQAEDTS
jgi:hypothetical protein